MLIPARLISLYDAGVSLLQQGTSLPPLLARITIGEVFITSGWAKLHNLPQIVDYFRSLNIPQPEIQAPFAAGSELVFGALVLVGLFTRIAAIPLMVIMTVAIITAKAKELTGIDELFGFIEYLYIALLFWLLVAGPGFFSLDRLLLKIRPLLVRERK